MLLDEFKKKKVIVPFCIAVLAIIGVVYFANFKYMIFVSTSGEECKIYGKVCDTIAISPQKGILNYELIINRPKNDSTIEIDFVNVDDVVLSASRINEKFIVRFDKFQYRLNRVGSELHKLYTVRFTSDTLYLHIKVSIYESLKHKPFFWIAPFGEFEDIKKEFMYKDRNTSLLITFMFGMFFLQLIYALIMAITLNKPEYWYYFAFIFEYFRLNLVFFQYQLDLDFGYWLFPNSILVQTCIMFFFYVRFARHFFSGINESVAVECFSLVCCFFYLLIPNQFSRLAYQEIALPVLYLFSLRMFYIIFRLRNPIKIYFLVGSLLLLSGAIISRILISSGYVSNIDHYTLRMFTYPVDFLLLNVALNKKRQLEIEKIKKSQQEDRLRIAKDLHDEVGSSIGSIPLFVHAIKSMISETQNEIRVGLDHISRIAESSGFGLREAVWVIDSRKEYLRDIQVQIEEYINPLAASNGIEYQITSNLTTDKISPTFKRNIWLFLKEGVNNAIKHSMASKIDIELYLENGKLTCSVYDNGIGFDQLKVMRTGNGLNNMTSRALDLNGELSIKSQAGYGTRICLTAPLQKND
jgi:signal transduction histidine kinase